MDTRRRFHREDLPYYQDWIRKITGKKNIWVKDVDGEWVLDIFGLSKYPQYIIDMWDLNIESFLNASVGWAHKRTIRLNCNFFERPMQGLHFRTFEVRAILLHEAGHILNMRSGHGRATQEYIADLYALQKASKLGLESELLATRTWIKQRRFDNDRFSRITHRMFRKASII